MLVIGHRGAAAIAPENTIQSFVAALHAGADAVELDARLTADGAVVLMHEDDVFRTTGASGYVSRMALDEVRSLDASKSLDGWQRVEPVPLLEEVLDLVGGRVPVFLEVKGALTPDGYRSAVPVVHAIEAMVRDVPDVTLSSFEPDAVAAAKAVFPGTPTGVGCLSFMPATWAIETAIDRGFDECHVAQESVDAAVVEAAVAAGLRVLAWTVNDEERARALRDIGVHGVFTDDPARIRAALRD